MKSSKMLKASAREQLLGNYSTAVMTYAMVHFLISLCLSSAESQLSINNLGSILIYIGIYLVVTLLSAIFIAGEQKMYLNLARGDAFLMKDVFWAFRGYADRSILVQFYILLETLIYGIPFLLSCLIMKLQPGKATLLLSLFTLLMWGIFAIKIQIQYAQALYLIGDSPNMSAKELLTMSKQLMLGHQARYLFLMISFFGMAILNVITFGLATFWIHPYMTATKTCFYLDLMQEQ